MIGRLRMRCRGRSKGEEVIMILKMNGGERDKRVAKKRRWLRGYGGERHSPSLSGQRRRLSLFFWLIFLGLYAYVQTNRHHV